MLAGYFPIGIARGIAFLGRKEESQQLVNNIKNGRHTLLLAPRRYGKTSLIKHVIKEMKLPSQEIDLFLANDEHALERKILKGAKALIDEASDTPEQWFKEILSYFRKSNKKWSIGIRGLKLELEPENHDDIPDNILEALNTVELVLKKKKQKAIFFIDEVQEIANIKNSRGIEGAIRHFAQESKYLIFIFSGSNQHMLKHMFEDKTRPLYALCERITLGRLDESTYKQYLNYVAKKTWRKILDENVFDRIMELTELHPRTVYVLCGYLWDEKIKSQNPPTLQDVNAIWNKYIRTKLKDVRNDLQNRSMGQVNLLTLIAMGKLEEITGQESQRILDMSGSAISQAIQKLEKYDYIEKSSNNKYTIIDPLIKNTLVQYNLENLGV